MVQAFGNIIGNAISNLTGSAFGNSENQSQTVYDPYASLFEKRLTSNMWREDTRWYNDRIVGSAYQRARNSLENAGYNPLMALNNGGLYDQAPTMGGMATKSSAKDVSRNTTMNKLANSENALNLAKTDYTSALATSEGIKQIGYQTDNLIKESEKVIASNNAKWQEKRNATEIKNIASQTQKNIAEIGLVNTQKTLNSAQEAYTRTNTEIVEGQRDYQKEHPLLYTTGKATGDILPVAGVVAGGGAYVYNKYKNRKKPIGFK